MYFSLRVYFPLPPMIKALTLWTDIIGASEKTLQASWNSFSIQPSADSLLSYAGMTKLQ